MKYFLILFIVIFFCSSDIAGTCEVGFSTSRVDKQAFLRKANEKLERDLQDIRSSPEEPGLKKQGFKPEYYRGLDLAREFNRVKKYLQEIKADPKHTHISYFAAQIKKVIAVFEKEFIEQNKEDVEFLEERLELLANFKRDAQQRIETQEVTYDWWVTFNTRLAALGTKDKEVLLTTLLISREPGDHETFTHYFKNYEAFERLLSQHRSLLVDFGKLNTVKDNFPEEVIFFIPEDIGIMAINRMGNGVYFIGVTGKKKFADGSPLEPIIYFTHDINHVYIMNRLNIYYDGQTNRDVIRKLNRISNPADRKKAELALFLFQHESVYDLYIKDYLLFEFNITGVSFMERGLRENMERDLKDKIDQALKIESSKTSSTSVKERKKKVLRDSMREYLFNREFSRFKISHDLRELLPDHLQNVKSNKDQEKLHKFLNETIDVFMEHFSDIFIP